jgi:fatty acid desaturase
MLASKVVRILDVTMPAMNEVFVRRDVIDPAKLRKLCVPSNFAGSMQALSHLSAIFVTGSLLWLCRSSFWAVPLFVAQGILLNFLYAGQHELSHWTVFRTAWPNEWLGRLFGFVVFYPRTFDQIQHIAHHRFTQDWARDGELNRARYTRGSFLLWMSGLTYWYTRWLRIVRFSLGIVTEPYLPTARHRELIREARIHLIGYASIAAISIGLRSWAAVLLWLAPMLALKGVHQLQNTIEHLGLPHEANVLINTRSTRTNALMRWMAWQMQYHTAHHAFPGVPFHRLPELHHEIFLLRGAAPPSMTYLGFLRAALRAFSAGRAENHYSDDAVWIADPKHV